MLVGVLVLMHVLVLVHMRLLSQVRRGTNAHSLVMRGEEAIVQLLADQILLTIGIWSRAVCGIRGRGRG